MEKEWLANDCFYVDKRQNASRVLGYLRGDRKEVPIIEDNGRPYAIIDPRGPIRRGLTQGMHIEKMAWPVPIIQDGDNEAGILARFASSGASYLPAYLGRPPRKAGYLDANTFLQHAYQSGPSAASLAQGVPPLWADSTIEDAVQAFAASALPYLPVITDKVDGIVRRHSVMPYLEHNPGGMGRRDVAGNRSEIRPENLEALIEDYAPTLAADADFETIKEALNDQPVWFIDHEGIQAITAVGVLQAIHALSAPPIQEEQAAHFRQVRR